MTFNTNEQIKNFLIVNKSLVDIIFSQVCRFQLRSRFLPQEQVVACMSCFHLVRSLEGKGFL